MNYPNNIKKCDNNYIDYKNRGMFLENIINETNLYYIEKKRAYIYKKPTPIGVIKTKGAKLEGYFKEPSTLDYNGLYKGHYIEFDAKECSSKTSFPLKNIKDHQLKHIKNIYKNNGIIFLIILMNDNYYLLNSKDLLDFINNNERKSIPYNYIKEKGHCLSYNYLKGLNYLDIIDNILEEL